MRKVTITLASKEESAVKGADSYKWFKYTGKRATIVGSKKKVEISPGDVFGLRASSNGKESRMVTKKDGLTKVYTLAEIEQIRLNKYASPTKAPKLAAGPASPKPAPAKPAAKVIKPLSKKEKQTKIVALREEINGKIRELEALKKQLEKIEGKRDPKLK